MPIDRGGKHWCEPAAETPDENGAWTCPGCGTVWTYEPAGRLWSATGERVKPAAAAASNKKARGAK